MSVERTFRGAAVLALSTCLAASVSLAEESKEAKIARARSAAPERISADATVVDIDGTVLAEGTNRWTCIPGVMPGDDHPLCNDEVWMKLLAAMGKEEGFQTDRVGVSYMLQGDMHVNNADPADKEPSEGETWIQEGPHLMVVFPDAKTLEAFPDDPGQGGPYVMWKDTPYAHIMVPVGPKVK